MSKDDRIWYLRLFLITVGFISLGLLGWLLSIPRSPGGGGVLGFSTSRLGMLLLALLLVMCSFGGAYATWKRVNWAVKVDTWFASKIKNDWFYYLHLLLCGILLLGSAYFLIIGNRITDMYLRAYFDRIAPFALWGIGFSVASIVLIRFYRLGNNWEGFSSHKTIVIPFMVTLVCIAITAFFMMTTGIGLTPDIVGWGDPGVPLLPTQVFIGIGLTALLTMVLRAEINKSVEPAGDFEKKKGLRLLTDRRIDIGVFLIIWLAAIFFWQAEPLNPSYFAPEPKAPNYEYYPYSDAANYDLSAQLLILGQGFEENVRRPVLSAFFALAQGVSGIGYQSVLDWQIPVLALIPPLLFLLGKELHHRATGVFAALLAILHESNGIALSGIIGVSHSKLLMSDLPTALGIIGITLLLVLWAKKTEQRIVYLLVMGGILGLTALIRIQVLILVPVFFVLVWIVERRGIRRKLQMAALMGIGLAVVLVPWLWRNWQVTGKITFSEATQASQIGLIGERYAGTVKKEESVILSGETENEYANRMLHGALDYLVRSPAGTLEFIGAHFLHNQVSTILVLPAEFTLTENLIQFYGLLPYWEGKPVRLWAECCSLTAYVKGLPYWQSWDGKIDPSSTLPLLLALALLSLGIAASWQHNQLIGLFPLIINFAYSIGNALVRTSGWRFNLPVDWVSILYYGIGLVQFGIFAVLFFRNRSIRVGGELKDAVEDPQRNRQHFPWLKASLIGLLFFAISVAIPAAEKSVEPIFGDWDRDREVNTLTQYLDLETRRFVNRFLEQDNVVIVPGRVLYPRFYEAGQGEPGSGWTSFARRDFDRLGFYLAGPNSKNVIVITDDHEVPLRHGEDVVVIGCPQEDYFEAAAILKWETDHYISDDLLSIWKCSE